jgi:hypothetical protein
MTDHTNVDLSVRVNGNAVATYTHEGKTFVEAKDGTQYHLHVKNRNLHRVKVVLSVDGINIVSGKPATGEQEETGYILEPNESQTFKGYRLDDDSVAAFKFTKAEGGYAQVEQGLKGTTGIIGCKVWKEKVAAPVPVTIKEVHHHHNWDWRIYPWYTTPHYWLGDNVYRGTFTTSVGSDTFLLNSTSAGNTFSAGGEVRCMAMNACAAPQAEAVQSSADLNPFDAGSTFGERVESKMISVAFVVDYCLGETNVFYAFRAGLTALGIDLTKSAKVAFPIAFSGKYAQPPKGWKG